MRPSTSLVTNSRRIAAASSLATTDRMSPSSGLPVGESHVSRKKVTSRAPMPSRPGAQKLRTALEYDDGPIALRYPRGEGTGVQLPGQPRALKIGTGEILREGGAG